jgi:hypothetical protein
MAYDPANKTAVQTVVTRDEAARWHAEADRRDESLSRFVRRAVRMAIAVGYANEPGTPAAEES